MKKIIITVISFFALSFLLQNYLYAATLWVNTGGSATSPYDTKAKGLRTISAGVNAMSTGDTLIIADGTYSGISNRVYGMPSGTVNAYTKIIAETDFGVTLDGVHSGWFGPPVDFNSKSYIEFRGFNINRSICSIHVRATNSNHIKVIRCSSDGTGSDGGSFTAGENSSYTLFEECFAYGLGRYPFGLGGANASHAIFRRCVVRFDGSYNTEPTAGFSSYERPFAYFQNCIVIDGNDVRSVKQVSGLYKGWKGFYMVKGSDNVGMYGNIVLNHPGTGYFVEHEPLINAVVKNCVAWDLKNLDEGGQAQPYFMFIGYGAGPATFSNNTFGVTAFNSSYGAILQSQDLVNATFTNNIISYATAMPASVYAVYQLDHSSVNRDYNCYYGNAGNRDFNYSTGVEGHSLCNANSNAVNPLTSGLKYLPRIESSTTLKTAGSGGGQIGAQIIYRYGRDADEDGISGLLYGETGWDELQDGSANSGVRKLWPFPNEDIIRTKAKAYSMARGQLVTSNWTNCTVDSGTNLFTSNAHGLTANTVVTLKASILPNGTDANKAYYVSSEGLTVNNFKLTYRYGWTSSVGGVVDVTSSGTNVQWARGWDNPELDGDRGFCADGQTLTKYIWEYLGNPIPADIYASDSIAPSAVNNLSASTGTNDGQVNLTWTAPGDDGSSGTASSYDVRYSSLTINTSNWASATPASGEPIPTAAGSSQSMTISGLTGGQTYYFAIKTQDNAANVSGLSNITSAQAKQAVAVLDTTPPYATGYIPAKNAINIAPDSNIVVHIKDAGAGVDINTIVMKVNGVTVTPTITGTPADYTLTYDPPASFTTGQAVSVTVTASDLAP